MRIEVFACSCCSTVPTPIGFGAPTSQREITLHPAGTHCIDSSSFAAPAKRGGRLAVALVAVLALLLLSAPSALAANEGDLDEAFSTDGKATYISCSPAYDVLVQPDGKVLLICLAQGSAGTRFAVVRLNADGSTDSGFGEIAGRAVVSFGDASQNSIARAAALQDDGKIVVVGETRATDSGSSSYRKVAIARLNANGTLDTSFSGDGKQIVDGSFGTGVESTAADVAIEAGSSPDVVIAGSYGTGTADSDFLLLRVFPNGSIQTSGADFSTGGKDIAAGVALDADGNAVVAGESTAPGATNGDFAIARFLGSNGALDTSFSLDGKTLRDISGDDSGADVAVQPDGKIVIGGNVSAADHHLQVRAPAPHRYRRR